MVVGAVAVHTVVVVALQALVVAQAQAQEARRVQEPPRQLLTVVRAAVARVTVLLAERAQVEFSR